MLLCGETGKEVLSDSYKIVTLEGDLGGTLLEVTAKVCHCVSTCAQTVSSFLHV